MKRRLSHAVFNPIFPFKKDHLTAESGHLIISESNFDEVADICSCQGNHARCVCVHACVCVCVCMCACMLTCMCMCVLQTTDESWKVCVIKDAVTQIFKVSG